MHRILILTARLALAGISRALTIAAFVLTLMGSGAGAACINLQQGSGLTLEGVLTYRIFPGPPNYEDVRRGDTPEPAYIVKLDSPICITGDDFVDSNTKIDNVQVYPEDQGAGNGQAFRDLRRLVGQRVQVEGKSAFGAHTAHHKAPLMLPITRVAVATDPTDAYGTPMTTVRAFYLALAAGSGSEAARFVVAEKRAAGPLSADAITRFYGNLAEPLSLIGVERMAADEYRVRYAFVARGGKRCDGVSMVRTRQVRGENLIELIKSLSGC
ncbi:MAG: DUF4431 domain-containing protein [bacterium]|nr:DUF4431 domain-containing protein [bacterium]